MLLLIVVLMEAGSSLKEWVFAIGVILLVSGLISLAASNSSRYGRMIIIEFAGRNVKPDSWEVSANFSKGDYICADFRPAGGWGEPPYDFSSYFPGVSFKAVFLDIVPPEGNRTRFSSFLMFDPGTQSFGGFLAKTVIDHGSGLDVNNVSEAGGVSADVIRKTIGGDAVEDFGGIALYDGTYRLLIYRPIPSEPDVREPSYTALCERPFEYPLAFLLPVGAPVAVIGLGLTVWAVKSKKAKVTSTARTS